MYVVIESTPGYLPEDDDPATFEDLTEARTYASDMLSRLLDFIVEGYEEPSEAWARVTVSGSFQEDRAVYVIDGNREHDLGRVIEILDAEPEA